ERSVSAAALEVLFLALDELLVLGETLVDLVGQLLELLLALLAQLGLQHLAPQRREGERRHGRPARAAGEAIEAVRERRGRVEPAPVGEGAHLREAVAQALEAVMIDHRLHGLVELGIGEVGHASASDDLARRGLSTPMTT